MRASKKVGSSSFLICSKLACIMRGVPHNVDRSAGPSFEETVQQCNSAPELQGIFEYFPEDSIGHCSSVLCVLVGSAAAIPSW